MLVKEYTASRSNPQAKPYETLLDTETGRASCNCPGWTVKRGDRPRECKHTRAIVAHHGVAGVAEQAQADRAGAVAARGYDAQPGHRSGVPTVARVEPMLASAMVAGQTLDRYEGDERWSMEVKWDGVRMMVTVEGGRVTAARSRAGNGRELPAHLREALSGLRDGTYDGELVVPGGTSTDVARVDLQRRLELMLFDVVELVGRDVTGLTLAERRELLGSACALAGPGVTVSEAFPVSRRGVEAVWAAGGEGVVLKRLASTYRPGYRSPDWLKVKKELAVVVTVVGFETGDTGIAFGKTRVRDDRGREFTVKTLNAATIRQVAADPQAFVGRRLVVKCNEVLASGALRHPMFDHWAGEAER